MVAVQKDTERDTRKWWNKRGREGTYDTIVIGSGMGGMTCAALLAKLGKKVLVLEQHYVPGGFTHMFKRPGYTWDVGVHAVGEVTKHSVTGRLLKKLTDGELEWASLGPVYDTFEFPDGFAIDFPDSPEAFRANLLAAFPGEGAAIDRYFDRVREVTKSMRAYYMAKALPRALSPLADRLFARKARGYFQENTAEVLAEITDNKKLRTVLASQWGYYGSVPSRSSFAIQALVTKHFSHGGYYPVGGASEIARTLLKTVAKAGGWTRISTDVEEILVEDGKAVGVRLKKTGEEIRAKRVISAAGVMATTQRLLPERFRNASWMNDFKALEPAPAHVCLYIGFKGDIASAGATAANQWFYNTWSTEADSWDVTPEGDIPDAAVLYVSFPSLKDPEHEPGPEQRHTGEIVTFVPWESFEKWRDSRWKKRGDDYEAFKKRLTDKLLSQFLARRPDLAPLVDVVELSTPLSTDTFTRPMKGSIYGIEPTPERFANTRLRPHSPIKNLYFAGSEVVSVGVIGAMMGGVLAAMAAEPLRMIRYMRKV
ncbi:MAG: all-trans-retinol 13,14-reductase [Myxococcota bacterium]|jgi:all-trans-retinol 13,14-reductase